MTSSGIDATLERLIGKGMNCFIMATAPNLRREKKTEYTPEFITGFTEKIKAYGDHLRRKGWADKAYVYVYDEAPRSAWPEVKKIDRAIKSAAPEARITPVPQRAGGREGTDRLRRCVRRVCHPVSQGRRGGFAEEGRGGLAGDLLLSDGPPQLLHRVPAAGRAGDVLDLLEVQGQRL